MSKIILVGKIFCKVWLKIMRKVFLFDVRFLFEISSVNFRPFYSKECKVVKASKSNIKDVLQFQDERYVRIFLRFLDENDEGYLGYINNKCIHRQWIQQNKVVSFSPVYKYKLKSDELYCHYVETASEVRGQGISKIVLSHIALKHSNKKILLVIQKNNVSSIKFCQGIGGKKIKKIFSIMILGINFSFQKNISKNINYI